MTGTAAALIPEIYVLPNSTPAQTFNPCYFDSFVNYIDRTDTTTRNYKSYIRHFAEWLTGQGIEQPTRDTVKAYKDHLKAAGYKPTTQAVYLAAVKYFFKWTAWEGIYPNISERIHGATIRHDVHRRDALEQGDVKTIADSIDRTTEQGRRNYALFLLAVTCGLRTCEISRADVGDIKTKGDRKYLYIMGKGHSEKDTPVLIVPEVDAALQEYLTTREAPATPKAPLFTSTSNRSKGERIAVTTLSTTIKNIMRAAGYDSDRLTAHSLRHSSATACYMATGGDLLQTQQHCRHADASTTQIYTHIADRDRRNTEQVVYNFYFDSDTTASKREAIKAIVDTLEADKLDSVLQYLKSL